MSYEPIGDAIVAGIKLLFGAIVGLFVAVVVLAALLITGCGAIDIVVDTDPVLDTDVDAGGGCRGACSNIAELGCDGAEGSPGPDEVYGTEDDVPCAEVCEETEGAGVSMETGCVSAADDCDAVDACFN